MSTVSLYTPLDARALEIRILTLLPAPPGGDDSAEIRCELSVASLSLHKCPRYEALSYVWGDVSTPRRITVNGRDFKVTVNLEAALRRLRASKSRRLWVDAICINQDDVAEKSTQIPLMGRVYAGASSVVAWLGNPTPDVEAAFRWAMESESRSWLRILLMLVPMFGDERRRRWETHFSQGRSGFLDILSRPYWSRMWTFQEFWLAKKSPVLVCGAFESPFSTFISRASFLLDWEITLQEERLGFENHQGLISPLGQKLIDLGIDDFNTHSSRQWLSEIEFLKMTSNRVCQHQHDRIYALYGLMPDLAEACPPDYEKPMQQVLNETIAYLVRREQIGVAMYLFPCQGEIPEATTASAVRSWQPDIIAPSRVRLRISNDQDHYMPYPTVSLDFRDTKQISATHLITLSADATTISLPAWILGRCEILYRLSNDEKTAIAEVINLALLRNGFGEPAQHPKWHATTTCQDKRSHHRVLHAILSHTIFVGSHEDGRLQKPSEVLEMLEKLQKGDPIQTSSSGAEGYFLESACRVLPGKVFFSVMGRIGVSSRRIREGDEIIVSPKIPFPVVLRTESGGHQPPRFRMVAAAYVDGIMANKVRDRELCSRIQQQEREMLQIC
ncbi:hypothetical protein ACHAPT_008446 [Fusarium lateritium]